MPKFIYTIMIVLFICVKIGFSDTGEYVMERENMVQEQIEKRGIKNKNVLDAMRKVERHLFVPDDGQEYAYRDFPVSIGYGQTISQPYIVAFMTEKVELSPEDRVLEIGTGSGYQAAVLAEIAKEVYTIEIVEPLYKKAKTILEKMGYRNIQCKYGDGYKGWPENQPYDKIIITAAPPLIPEELIPQLTVGGKMIVPVGEGFQELLIITRTEDGYDIENLLPVRFVPMVRSLE